MDSKKTTTSPYPAEFRERAEQMVSDHLDSHRSLTAAVRDISRKPGCSPDSLRVCAPGPRHRQPGPRQGPLQVQGAPLPRPAPRPHRPSQAASRRGPDRDRPRRARPHLRRDCRAGRRRGPRRDHRRGGLGPFLRSLAGLDREAAKAAFDTFLHGRSLTAAQTAFVDHVIDHLTAHGAIDPRRFYESPFTDLDGQGIHGLFAESDIHQILAIVRSIDESARVA